MVKNFLLLTALFVITLSCKKNPVNPEADNQAKSIYIEFYNPVPLNVDMNSYLPTIKGKISSEFPLVSYSVILMSNGNETTILEKNLEEVVECEFNVRVSYQLTSDSILIVAKDNQNQTKQKGIALVIKQLPAVEAVPVSNKDAFPGAEGHGRYTTGGRGGKILFVENLSDDGKRGSFRWALNQNGARTIVFRVSGTIELTSPLKIENGNFTIAGQSAPGDGICIAKNTVQLADGLNNIIIRYIRFRNAKGSGEYDAAWGRNCSNIIFDHCSFSWGNDEVASFYDNENFTMQWCIISESFYHSTHPKGDHGYGGIWGGMKASFHHNLIAHHTSRNPRFCGARYHQESRETEIVDFRNNVIYNWGDNSIYGGEYGQQNMVNNYFKAGPATKDSKKNRIVEITDADSKWYISGNYVDGYPTISSDNWSGGVQGAASDPGVKATSSFDSGDIITQSPEDAYESVLTHAGASFVRDVIDTRVCDEVKNGTTIYAGIYGPGIIDSELDVGGFPNLVSSDQYQDYDDDGMPDDWETKNGLDPKDPTDHKNYTLQSNYTNIEVFLNQLIESKK